ALVIDLDDITRGDGQGAVQVVQAVGEVADVDLVEAGDDVHRGGGRGSPHVDVVECAGAAGGERQVPDVGVLDRHGRAAGRRLVDACHQRTGHLPRGRVGVGLVVHLQLVGAGFAVDRHVPLDAVEIVGPRTHAEGIGPTAAAERG